MIPINDLSRIDQIEIDDLTHLIGEVVSSGWYVHGPYLTAFELSPEKIQSQLNL